MKKRLAEKVASLFLVRDDCKALILMLRIFNFIKNCNRIVGVANITLSFRVHKKIVFPRLV
jgi:hypothetical protein